MAIGVPFYKGVTESWERLSLQCIENLPERYPRIAITPSDLQVSLPGYELAEFDSSFFVSTDSYSHLLMSDDFYSRFDEFDFLLIVQLDALILNPMNNTWLNTPADYIGAPLFESVGLSAGMPRVGNGGLSLRRVSACRRVLNSESVPSMRLSTCLSLASRLPDIRRRPFINRIRKAVSVLRSTQVGARAYCQAYSLNEDRFWSDRAALFDPGFKVATVEEGLEFSFERYPRTCLELTNGRLPFGCHAWMKHDPEFWADHVPMTGEILSEIQG